MKRRSLWLLIAGLLLLGHTTCAKSSAPPQNTPQGSHGPVTEGTTIPEKGENNGEGDFLFVAENNGVTITGYTGNARDIVIPQTINGEPVVAVGNYAFIRKRLTSVTLPGTVTVIGTNAFSHNRLAELILPDSVTAVEHGAFSNNRLSSVNLSNSLTFIGTLAFAGNRIKKIILPDSIEFIGHMAFSRNQLDEVIVPERINTFNSRAFDSYVRIIWER